MNETWTKFMAESEQPRIITFDFDGTLTSNRFSYSPYSTSEDVGPNLENIERIKKFKKEGARVYIVTRRLKEQHSIEEIVAFVRAFKLPIDGLHFTNLQDKVHTLMRLGCQMHFDDDPQEIAAIKQYAPYIKAVKVHEDGSVGEH